MVGELSLKERPLEQMCIQVDCTYSKREGSKDIQDLLMACHKGVYFLLHGLPSLQLGSYIANFRSDPMLLQQLIFHECLEAWCREITKTKSWPIQRSHLDTKGDESFTKSVMGLILQQSCGCKPVVPSLGLCSQWPCVCLSHTSIT